MSDNDLRDHLSGLFSDIVPEPDLETEAEAEEEEFLPLEERVVFGLLEDDVAFAAPERTAAEPALSAPVGPEGSGVEVDVSSRRVKRSAATPSWRITLGKRSISILSLLLYGVLILGGAPLVFLLVRFIWQGEVAWSSLPFCLTFYTLAVVVTLVQWFFNSSLSKTAQEVEERLGEALRLRTFLEGRVQEIATANASLQRRVLQLQAGTEISRSVIAILELDRLLPETVSLIRDRFDLYHVGLFLIDQAVESADGMWAVLQAGTGEVGFQMLAQGHRFAVNDESLVGRCILDARARIALDNAAAHDWLRYEDESLGPGEEALHPGGAIDAVEYNSLLPKTRSQMVLPLLVDGRVIGALDIHSTEREAFSKRDIPAFQALADYVAAAIGNARVFAETRSRLEELVQSSIREQRSRLAPSRSVPLYERVRSGVRPFGDVVPPEIEHAVTEREAVVRSDVSAGGRESTLVVPVALRDQVFGALGLQEVETGRQWTDDEVALIEAVATQMALAIENARLLEGTRRRAERERLTSDITAQVRASTDVDTILRTAIRELGQALRASDGAIRLGGGDAGSLLSEE